MSAAATQRPRPLRLLGCGVAEPELVSSAALDQRLGLAPGTVEARSGVQTRPVHPGHAAALGAQAARAALASAALSPSEIDLLLCASATGDQALPCNAALLQRELGWGGAGMPAFDLNASCLGFLVALEVVAALLNQRSFRRVLVVSADIASCGLDWSTLEASAIFGDGAAAAVFALPVAQEDSALLSFGLETYGDGADDCRIDAGGSRFHPSRVGAAAMAARALFRMQPERLYKRAARVLPALVERVLAQAGLTRAEIACVVPHQASHQGLAHMRKRLGLPAERFIDIYRDHGNQVAASLPTALHHAISSGALRRGQLALLLGTGAGLSVGAAVLRY